MQKIANYEHEFLVKIETAKKKKKKKMCVGPSEKLVSAQKLKRKKQHTHIHEQIEQAKQEARDHIIYALVICFI